MKRRDFLKAVVGVVIGGGLVTEVLSVTLARANITAREAYDRHIKDYLHKMRNFNQHHEEDVCLTRKLLRLLESCVKRFERVQRTVGHGNFYLLSFDEAIQVAKNYPRVGRFSQAELDFLEMIFYLDASRYGFFGEKPLKSITDRVQKREVVKVPGTGNYLYRGSPLETYKRIKREVGDQAVLTSGVRSVIKQFLLFLVKTYENQGNLSLASRSLAPPGYSYHGIGDFDVGQCGLGADNFTERFTTTRVYRTLSNLGYLNIRYPMDNLLRVRFEPWHIKVV
jgi:hypothetical protein